MNLIVLLKLLLNAEAYGRYGKHIDLVDLKSTSRELWYPYHVLQELRKDFPETNISLDEFTSFFWARYPDANKDTYDALFGQMRDAEVSPEMGSAIIAAIERREGLVKLAEAAMKASQGDGTTDEIKQLVEALDKPQAQEIDDDTFITTDIESIVSEVVAKPGIRWALECLNKSLGSLRQGDFGFVFARPETGKTTFIAHTVGHALGQLPQGAGPVVWFNNEEQDNKVMLRVVQSYFGIPLHELLGNVKKYNELFRERVGNRFRLVNSSKVDISKESVEKILASLSPSLIVYDQIDKIKGFKADREDLALGAIYQWARELAKKYAPTIGVCQADGSGEGQKWLTMANVANAKTSKQAEADFIIGIGKTHDEAAEAVRYLNLSKNKLMGDSDSDPSLRHARLEVIIQPDIARYRDVIDYSK